MKARTLLPSLILIFLVSASASAGIVLDYSHDSSTDNFFGANATAKAAVDAAAADINTVIKTILNAITNDVITGTNGSTTATFNWNWSYTNPSTGATVDVLTATIGVGEVKVFVGMRELAGTTLGQGGPGGVGFSFSGGGFPSEWEGAVADAESKSNTAYGRGGGPTIHNTSGSSTLGGTTANFSIDHGSSLGNLWFDIDTDNNGSADDATTLASFWHFDHTTDVAAGKNDLYSVALHEILHAIGIGTSDSWDGKVSGTNWTGAEVIKLVGSGANLIDGDGAHIAEGTMSTVLFEGTAQEAVMDPTLTVGTRKKLTELDIAFLRDIGWSAIPEPSSLVLAGIALLGALGVGWRRRAAAA